ncbi:MAG: radical SAM protein, partial [Anaerolineales bacterium]|nr:radical SAM protein [Anaerolineales bacterium]
GYSQETYEAVTGVPGSHARCMRGIELLLERKLPLRLKTVLMNLNYHELEPMRQFAESLGVEFRVDPLINAGVVEVENPLATRITPEQVVWYDVHDEQSRQSWERSFQRIAAGEQPQDDRLYTCKAGTSSFHIDPYGRLSLCTLEREPYYDLRQGSFIEGWHSFLNPLAEVHFSPHSACGSCELRSACVRCPGRARLETGDPEGVSEYYCQVTQLRQKVFSGVVSLDEIRPAGTVHL